MTRAVLYSCLSLSLACRSKGDDSPIDSSGWQNPQPKLLEDNDPDPMVFDGDLAAAPARWSYSPGISVSGLAYNGLVPGPLVRVPLGALVRLHFRNELPEDFETMVHWHGIEGNNAADGTHVTQHPLVPGDSFDYTFTVTRPGLYWYHPHARGAQGVFEGLYAPLIVDDPDEPDLIASGVLPEDERILVLSDLSEYGGKPLSAEVDNAMEIMNGTEGEHLLVNGREDPVFTIGARRPVRLRLVNTSITRFWRLSVPEHTLHRVGGEGGLLDAVRIEGGSVVADVLSEEGEVIGTREVSLGYARGEILLAPGERADVVLVPEGEPGDVLELRWEDYARGRHGMWMEGDEMVMGDLPDDGARPGQTVATFALTEATPAPWTLTEGDPVLGAVGRQVGAVDLSEALDWTGPAAMVLSERMDMWQNADGVWEMSTELFLDGQSWTPAHPSDHSDPPLAPTAVHAKLGQTLLWEARNESEMAHPLHLHGFSYQIERFVREDEETGEILAWRPGYDEFEDTTLLPGHTSALLRVHLGDPLGDGGALGRWMRHCHILQHGENGMMSELVVEP